MENAAASKPPTIDDLKRIANETMSKLVLLLKETRYFPPMIVVVGPQGQPLDVPFPPNMLNSNRLKDILFDVVAKAARAVKASAVIVVTDGYTLSLSDEENRRVQTDKEYYERYKSAMTSGKGIDWIVAAGFGRKVECIMVTIQTPSWSRLMQQEYERIGDEIKFGKRNVLDSGDGGVFEGRLMDIWNEEAKSV